MSASVSPSAPARPEAAPCALHPERPAVGKKHQALQAMVLGGLGLLGWTYVVVRLRLGLPLNPL